MTLLNIMRHKNRGLLSEGVLALGVSMRFDTLLRDAAVSTQLVSDKVGAHSTCEKDAAETEPGTRNNVFMKVFFSIAKVMQHIMQPLPVST